MIPGDVRPPVALLTELDTREILAKSLLALCSEHGPTRVGKTVGCNEKTIRDARDEKSTLGLDTAVNLLALDPCALDGFLAHFGRRSVAIAGADVSDHAFSTALSRLMLEWSIAMEDGRVDDVELARMRRSLAAAGEAIDAKRVAAA